jgi:hypothetical protein
MKRYSLLLLLFSASARAHEIETLDLAALVPGSEIEQTVLQEPCCDVKVINGAPKHSYTLRADVETIPIVELNFSAPTTLAVAFRFGSNPFNSASEE